MAKNDWLPAPIKNLLRDCRDYYVFSPQRKALRALSRKDSKRIVIGSSGTELQDWVSTDRQVIDLLRESTWRRYFAPGSLDAIVAEHVWEHLTPDEARISARTCYQFLRPGGYLRVAVPDGFHPDDGYIDSVRLGGTGPGAEDHKVLYTYASFRDLFRESGFEVRLYEYFDENGAFQFNEWDPSDGMIVRSKRFDGRNSADGTGYTSIVLDAVKPDIPRS